MYDCVLNMYVDDVVIYKTATSKDELEYRLQICIDDISNWYSMNKLCINKKKSNVMVIGSKWQLKSLNLDNFTISAGGRLNKKDGLTRYGNSHVKDKTS